MAVELAPAADGLVAKPVRVVEPLPIGSAVASSRGPLLPLAPPSAVPASSASVTPTPAAPLTPSAPPTPTSVASSSARKRRPPALTFAPKTPSPASDSLADQLVAAKVRSSGGPSPKASSTPQTSAGSTSSAGNVLSLPTPPGSSSDLEIQRLDELSKIVKLGQGSSGVVEKHLHIRTGREVALKMISAGEIAEAQQKAILLELRTFAKCRNPHIVDFYGAFHHDNFMHIALEFMNAGALSDVLEVRKTVPERDLANITWQVLDGLEYLHKQMKVIHRDVKPSNLLLNTHGAVKITDFGVSGELQDELAQSGNKHTWVGTIYYMSPERVQGQPYRYDSDLWSLGLTIFECLSGRYPYTNRDKSSGKKELSLWQLMRCVVEQDAPQLPDDSEFSEQVRAFLGAVLQKVPKRRPSGTALKAHAWLDGANTPARQAAVASWIAGGKGAQPGSAGSDAASEGGSQLAGSSTLGTAGTPERAAPEVSQGVEDNGTAVPLMRSSLRSNINPFANACTEVSQTSGEAICAVPPATSMGTSVRGGGNPFARPPAGNDAGSMDAGANRSMGSSVRGGSNPFARSSSKALPCEEDRLCDGAVLPGQLEAHVGKMIGTEPVTGAAAQGGRPSRTVHAPAALRAGSPSSRERLLGPALLARWPDAGAREGLGEAELTKWEVAVHRIASAFHHEPGTAGADGVTLPCRVEAAGFGLFLGDAACSRDVAALQALGIGAVMNCGAPAVEYPEGFRHLEVACEDAEGYPLFARHLEECLGFMERCEAAGTGLLVHCVMGLNRSTSFVVAFLTLRRGLGLLDAVARVWEGRGRSPILTNRSFRRQLVQLSHLTGHLS